MFVMLSCDSICFWHVGLNTGGESRYVQEANSLGCAASLIDLIRGVLMPEPPNVFKPRRRMHNEIDKPPKPFHAKSEFIEYWSRQSYRIATQRSVQTSGDVA